MLGRLGKLPPRQDSRTLRLARYLDRAEIPPPPDCSDWSEGITSWPMHRNDAVGDCTCAAAAHAIQAWTTRARGAPAIVPDDDVIAAYHSVSGYDPSTGANDNGAVELDVLRLWRKYGIGGHRILAFAAVDVHDTWEVRTALHLFGGLYIGAALPLSAQDEDGLWFSDVGGDPGRTAPGSWGGHAMYVPAYSQRDLEVVTWGAQKRITWAWWDRYVDEAWAILSTDWIAPDQRAPSGFAVDVLLQDLERVAA